MQVNQIYAVYFSGTGTTKKVVELFAQQLQKELDAECKTIDFTLPKMREQDYLFEKNSIVVFGVPVYAGRVPNVLLPFLKEHIKGEGAIAVPLVLYGNRNYDDALIELRNILEENGMYAVAAGAFVGEHSFSTILGANRPDETDRKLLMDFAQQTANKIENLLEEKLEKNALVVKGESPIRPYYTPRDRHGNPINILKVKPKTSEQCDECGICAEVCPMGSISKENPKAVEGICIKCCACVKKCPNGAKYYEDEGYLYHQHELEEVYSRRAEPDIFL